MVFYLFIAIIALSAASYVFGRRRAVNVATFDSLALHSRPSYHGAFVALWAGLPSFVLVLLWLLFQGPIVDSLLVSSLPPERIEGLASAQIDLLVSEIKAVSRGVVFGEPDGHAAHH